MIRVVDLFSGVGGLTFGFQNEINNNRFVKSNKFKIVLANELDEDTANAFSLNLLGRKK